MSIEILHDLILYGSAGILSISTAIFRMRLQYFISCIDSKPQKNTKCIVIHIFPLKHFHDRMCLQRVVLNNRIYNLARFPSDLLANPQLIISRISHFFIIVN